MVAEVLLQPKFSLQLLISQWIVYANANLPHESKKQEHQARNKVHA